jgi:hypothetical protein
MKAKEIKEWAEEFEEELMFMDGYDDCVCGLGFHFGNGGHAVAYSVDKIIKKLVKRDKMTYDEAQEFFDFNMEAAYVGPKTPIFIH